MLEVTIVLYTTLEAKAQFKKVYFETKNMKKFIEQLVWYSDVQNRESVTMKTIQYLFANHQQIDLPVFNLKSVTRNGFPEHPTRIDYVDLHRRANAVDLFSRQTNVRLDENRRWWWPCNNYRTAGPRMEGMQNVGGRPPHQAPPHV